jgi:methylated-DNA-[protein]-cysteine S-methyltransferase
VENTVILGTIETSFGVFGAALSPLGLGRLTFPTEPFALCEAWAKRWIPEARLSYEKELLGEVAAQLNAYFEGSLHEFTLPVDLRGTAFQKEVWQALQGIGYGEIKSYAQLATIVGKPQAVRAVGTANGANPVPIIVPCHRVIGSNGALTGYAGGLPLKQQLLQLEGSLML